MRPKEILVEHLHDSRDHARDGSPLDGYLCNCRQYIETLWPLIQSIAYNAYDAGVKAGRKP